MHEIESLENDIAAELARDMAPPTTFPFKGKPRPNIINVNEQPKVTEQPKAASDQLMVAVTGLIKLEEELNQFFAGLVGDLKKAETDDKPVPSQEGPMIPRMRSDAELVARLCIRIHKRIAEVKALL